MARIENKETTVIDPSEVRSTAATVTHGVRTLATANTMTRSIASTSPSSNSFVISTNAPIAMAVTPSQSQKTPLGLSVPLIIEIAQSDS